MFSPLSTLRFAMILIGPLAFAAACSSERTAEQKTTTVSQPVDSGKPVCAAQIPAVKIKSMRLDHMMDIPGELKAFQDVAIEAKAEGFIQSINVDRGSRVKTDDKMLTIFCPELDEHLKEQEAKTSSAVSALRKNESAMESIKSKLQEAKAKYDADWLTLQRLKSTSTRMPGSVAINDIDMQTKNVESDKARVEAVASEVKAAMALIQSDRSNVEAAKKVEQSVHTLIAYLTITAPFDGIITERNVHVGSMVGPHDKQAPLLRLRQDKVLRLVVAMPEDSVSGLHIGERIPFNVPAYPGTKFYGTLERPAFAIDSATRTMPVELDVSNADYKLQPGMFATVHWQIRRPTNTMFVPSTSVATDLKGTFVNVIVDDVSKRIPVQKGRPMQDLIEITGDVAPGDIVALNGTDELKDGTHLAARLVSQ